jgi:hypothetical protein
MEVRVQRDADARFGSSSLQDVPIIGAAHADFGHVDHVPAGLRKQRELYTFLPNRLIGVVRIDVQGQLETTPCYRIHRIGYKLKPLVALGQKETAEEISMMLSRQIVPNGDVR